MGLFRHKTKMQVSANKVSLTLSIFTIYDYKSR